MMIRKFRAWRAARQAPVVPVIRFGTVVRVVEAGGSYDMRMSALDIDYTGPTVTLRPLTDWDD